MKKFLISFAIGFVISFVIVLIAITLWFNTNTVTVSHQYISMFGINVMDVFIENDVVVKNINFSSMAVIGAACGILSYAVITFFEKKK